VSEGIIIKAYEAVLDAERWRGVLDELAYITQANASALLLREFGRPEFPYNISSLSKAYADFVDTPAGQHYLAELAVNEEPEWQLVSTMSLGDIWVDTDCGISLTELYARPDIACMLKEINVARRIAFRLNDNNAWFDTVTLGFGAECERIPAVAYEVVGWTWPHLAKALELTRTFSMLRARYNAVLAVLDKLAIGILIVLPSGEVLIANARAHEILDHADGLSRDAFGHLRCINPDQTAALRDAVAKASATAGGEGRTSEKLMLVSRKTGGQELLLDIAPLAESGIELDHTLRGCVIVVTDPDNPPDVDMQRFARLNGLTPAETEICNLVVAGNGVPDIAEMRAVSPNTVRNQIKAVLQKTGCTSRIQLLREAAKAMPPIL